MRSRRRLIAILAAFQLVGWGANLALAQLPGDVDSYRILSRLSVLNQTGGFAGVDQRYRLNGNFDFAYGSEFAWQVDDAGVAHHRYVPTAQFDNANIYAPLGPMLPAFIDVDHLLNLELLRGELLPLGIPTPVYRFKGVINDGIAASPLESSTIELYAALSGPWMYLWGETTPPPWTADYFSYEIKAVARTGRSADWNDDGVVDAADYTLARDLQSNPAAFPPDWGGEYALWRDQFGEKAPDVDAMIASFSAAMATSTALTIPEPSCLVLTMLSIMAVASARK